MSFITEYRPGPSSNNFSLKEYISSGDSDPRLVRRHIPSSIYAVLVPRDDKDVRDPRLARRSASGSIYATHPGVAILSAEQQSQDDNVKSVFRIHNVPENSESNEGDSDSSSGEDDWLLESTCDLDIESIVTVGFSVSVPLAENAVRIFTDVESQQAVAGIENISQISVIQNVTNMSRSQRFADAFEFDPLSAQIDLQVAELDSSATVSSRPTVHVPQSDISLVPIAPQPAQSKPQPIQVITQPYQPVTAPVRDSTPLVDSKTHSSPVVKETQRNKADNVNTKSEHITETKTPLSDTASLKVVPVEAKSKSITEVKTKRSDLHLIDNETSKAVTQGKHMSDKRQSNEPVLSTASVSSEVTEKAATKDSKEKDTLEISRPNLSTLEKLGLWFDVSLPFMVPLPEGQHDLPELSPPQPAKTYTSLIDSRPVWMQRLSAIPVDPLKCLNSSNKSISRESPPDSLNSSPGEGEIVPEKTSVETPADVDCAIEDDELRDELLEKACATDFKSKPKNDDSDILPKATYHSMSKDTSVKTVVAKPALDSDTGISHLSSESVISTKSSVSHNQDAQKTPTMQDMKATYTSLMQVVPSVEQTKAPSTYVAPVKTTNSKFAESVLEKRRIRIKRFSPKTSTVRTLDEGHPITEGTSSENNEDDSAIIDNIAAPAALAEKSRTDTGKSLLSSSGSLTDHPSTKLATVINIAPPVDRPSTPEVSGGKEVQETSIITETKQSSVSKSAQQDSSVKQSPPVVCDVNIKGGKHVTVTEERSDVLSRTVKYKKIDVQVKGKLPSMQQKETPSLRMAATDSVQSQQSTLTGDKSYEKTNTKVNDSTLRKDSASSKVDLKQYDTAKTNVITKSKSGSHHYRSQNRRQSSESSSESEDNTDLTSPVQHNMSNGNEMTVSQHINKNAETEAKSQSLKLIDAYSDSESDENDPVDDEMSEVRQPVVIQSGHHDSKRDKGSYLKDIDVAMPKLPRLSSQTHSTQQSRPVNEGLETLGMMMDATKSQTLRRLDKLCTGKYQCLQDLGMTTEWRHLNKLSKKVRSLTEQHQASHRLHKICSKASKSWKKKKPLDRLLKGKSVKISSKPVNLPYSIKTVATKEKCVNKLSEDLYQITRGTRSCILPHSVFSRSDSVTCESVNHVYNSCMNQMNDVAGLLVDDRCDQKGRVDYADRVQRQKEVLQSRDNSSSDSDSLKTHSVQDRSIGANPSYKRENVSDLITQEHEEKTKNIDNKSNYSDRKEMQSTRQSDVTGILQTGKQDIASKKYEQPNYSRKPRETASTDVVGAESSVLHSRMPQTRYAHDEEQSDFVSDRESQSARSKRSRERSENELIRDSSDRHQSVGETEHNVDEKEAMKVDDRKDKEISSAEPSGRGESIKSEVVGLSLFGEKPSTGLLNFASFDSTSSFSKVNETLSSAFASFELSIESLLMPSFKASEPLTKKDENEKEVEKTRVNKEKVRPQDKSQEMRKESKVASRSKSSNKSDANNIETNLPPIKQRPISSHSLRSSQEYDEQDNVRDERVSLDSVNDTRHKYPKSKLSHASSEDVRKSKANKHRQKRFDDPVLNQCHISSWSFYDQMDMMVPAGDDSPSRDRLPNLEQLGTFSRKMKTDKYASEFTQVDEVAELQTRLFFAELELLTGLKMTLGLPSAKVKDKESQGHKSSKRERRQRKLTEDHPELTHSRKDKHRKSKDENVEKHEEKRGKKSSTSYSDDKKVKKSTLTETSDHQYLVPNEDIMSLATVSSHKEIKGVQHPEYDPGTEAVAMGNVTDIKQDNVAAVECDSEMVYDPMIPTADSDDDNASPDQTSQGHLPELVPKNVCEEKNPGTAEAVILQIIPEKKIRDVNYVGKERGNQKAMLSQITPEKKISEKIAKVSVKQSQEVAPISLKEQKNSHQPTAPSKVKRKGEKAINPSDMPCVINDKSQESHVIPDITSSPLITRDHPEKVEELCRRDPEKFMSGELQPENCFSWALALARNTTSKDKDTVHVNAADVGKISNAQEQVNGESKDVNTSKTDKGELNDSAVTTATEVVVPPGAYVNEYGTIVYGEAAPPAIESNVQAPQPTDAGQLMTESSSSKEMQPADVSKPETQPGEPDSAQKKNLRKRSRLAQAFQQAVVAKKRAENKTVDVPKITPPAKPTVKVQQSSSAAPVQKKPPAHVKPTILFKPPSMVAAEIKAQVEKMADEPEALSPHKQTTASSEIPTSKKGPVEVEAFDSALPSSYTLSSSSATDDLVDKSVGDFNNLLQDIMRDEQNDPSNTPLDHTKTPTTSITFRSNKSRIQHLPCLSESVKQMYNDKRDTETSQSSAHITKEIVPTSMPAISDRRDTDTLQSHPHIINDRQMTETLQSSAQIDNERRDTEICGSMVQIASVQKDGDKGSDDSPNNALQDRSAMKMNEKTVGDSVLDDVHEKIAVVCDEDRPSDKIQMFSEEPLGHQQETPAQEFSVLGEQTPPLPIPEPAEERHAIKISIENVVIQEKDIGRSNIVERDRRLPLIPEKEVEPEIKNIVSHEKQGTEVHEEQNISDQNVALPEPVTNEQFTSELIPQAVHDVSLITLPREFAPEDGKITNPQQEKEEYKDQVSSTSLIGEPVVQISITSQSSHQTVNEKSNVTESSLELDTAKSSQSAREIIKETEVETRASQSETDVAKEKEAKARVQQMVEKLRKRKASSGAASTGRRASRWGVPPAEPATAVLSKPPVPYSEPKKAKLEEPSNIRTEVMVEPELQPVSTPAPPLPPPPPPLPSVSSEPVSYLQVSQTIIPEAPSHHQVDVTSHSSNFVFTQMHDHLAEQHNSAHSIMQIDQAISQLPSWPTQGQGNDLQSSQTPTPPQLMDHKQSHETVQPLTVLQPPRQSTPDTADQNKKPRAPKRHYDAISETMAQIDNVLEGLEGHIEAPPAKKIPELLKLDLPVPDFIANQETRPPPPSQHRTPEPSQEQPPQQWPSERLPRQPHQPWQPEPHSDHPAQHWQHGTPAEQHWQREPPHEQPPPHWHQEQPPVQHWQPEPQAGQPPQHLPEQPIQHWQQEPPPQPPPQHWQPEPPAGQPQMPPEPPQHWQPEPPPEQPPPPPATSPPPLPPQPMQQEVAPPMPGEDLPPLPPDPPLPEVAPPGDSAENPAPPPPQQQEEWKRQWDEYYQQQAAIQKQWQDYHNQTGAYAPGAASQHQQAAAGGVAPPSGGEQQTEGGAGSTDAWQAWQIAQQQLKKVQEESQKTSGSEVSGETTATTWDPAQHAWDYSQHMKPTKPALLATPGMPPAGQDWNQQQQYENYGSNYWDPNYGGDYNADWEEYYRYYYGHDGAQGQQAPSQFPPPGHRPPRPRKPALLPSPQRFPGGPLGGGPRGLLPHPEQGPGPSRFSGPPPHGQNFPPPPGQFPRPPGQHPPLPPGPGPYQPQGQQQQQPPVPGQGQPPPPPPPGQHPPPPGMIPHPPPPGQHPTPPSMGMNPPPPGMNPHPPPPGMNPPPPGMNPQPPAPSMNPHPPPGMNPHPPPPGMMNHPRGPHPPPPGSHHPPGMMPPGGTGIRPLMPHAWQPPPPPKEEQVENKPSRNTRIYVFQHDQPMGRSIVVSAEKL